MLAHRGHRRRRRLPDASRAWGVEVLDDGHVRLLLSTQADGHPAQRRATAARIALTATHFLTFESVQLKGVATRVEEATPADRIRFDRYCSGAAAAIAETDGTPARAGAALHHRRDRTRAP